MARQPFPCVGMFLYICTACSAGAVSRIAVVDVLRHSEVCVPRQFGALSYCGLFRSAGSYDSFLRGGVCDSAEMDAGGGQVILRRPVTLPGGADAVGCRPKWRPL